MDDARWWQGFNQAMASLAVVLGFLAYFWWERQSRKRAAEKRAAELLGRPEGKFGSFLAECFQRGHGAEVLAWDAIFSAYRRWCEHRKLRPMPNVNDELATYLETQGIEKRHRGRRMFCVGMRLVEGEPKQ
jgi:hypothetical protein